MKIQDINTRAKQLREENPDLSWHDAQKQAGAEFKKRRADRLKAITVALRINRFNHR